MGIPSIRESRKAPDVDSMPRMSTTPPALDPYRYELLPFASAESEAAAVGVPLTLTVTCSPKHGPDESVRMARRLVEFGHTVVVHIAARMVKSPEHLDRLLSGMAAAGVRHAFLIGGDAPQAAGPYASGLQLLQAVHEHRLRPSTLGVPGYPEGHPHIADEVLATELSAKSALADYIATQMCFDFDAVVGWLERSRDMGAGLPVYVGIPGVVDRKRLLEISVRVGVGTSISYLRKQHGVRNLLGGARSTAEELLETVAAEIGGPLGIAGIHFFTFNRLVETRRLVERQATAPASQGVEHLANY
jgi:methylenetetrahydrofolate reductase (NADPH)